MVLGPLRQKRVQIGLSSIVVVRLFALKTLEKRLKIQLATAV